MIQVDELVAVQAVEAQNDHRRKIDSHEDPIKQANLIDTRLHSGDKIVHPAAKSGHDLKHRERNKTGIMIRSQPSATHSGMAITRYRLLLPLAVLLEAAFLSLHRLENFKLQAVEFITTYLVVSLLYLVCCFLITNSGGDGALPRRWMNLIWGAGILFRLTVFPLDPMLSEDLNRYRWQGKLQAAGGNPYTEVPQDPRWEPLRDATICKRQRQELAFGLRTCSRALLRCLLSAGVGPPAR